MLDEQLRRLSKQALGREHLLELALVVITRHDESFVFDDLFDEVREAAVNARLEPPSVSAVRSDLERLRQLRAIERLPRARGELTRHEIRRRKAAFWQLVRELTAGAPSTEGAQSTRRDQ
jgi:hypothetical protein